MRRLVCITGLLFAVVSGAWAQGIVSDVFSGALIKPEPGVYAWYDLKDNTEGKTFFLRLAVVGEEKVNRKKGHWLETEVIPQVGFPAVYKMLLTGPAGDPKNIHQIIVKEGLRAPESIPVDHSTDAKTGTDSGEKRESLGKEKIATGQGEIEAEHVVITKPKQDNPAEVQKMDVWLNDEVRPMGIVKMTSADGELLLQRYGKGGADGTSHMDAIKQDETPGSSEVKVNVEGGKPLPPGATPPAAKESAPAADKPVETPAKNANPEKTKGGKGKKP
jgi:hypothetical protein